MGNKKNEIALNQVTQSNKNLYPKLNIGILNFNENELDKILNNINGKIILQEKFTNHYFKYDYIKYFLLNNVINVMINLFQRNPSIKSKQNPFIQNVYKILLQLDSIICLLLQYSFSQDIEFIMINILNLVFTSLTLLRESSLALNDNSMNIISNIK